MSAASQARRRRPAGELEIVAFERGPHVSYSACGIPYFVSGLVERADQLFARRIETFRDELDIDVRVRHEVVAIDLDRRTVLVRDLEARTEHTTAFDDLVLATGASPVRPPIDGIDATGVFGLQVLEDGIDLRRAVDDGPADAVVVGAGYIGLEVAEALASRGVVVTLVEAGAAPMHTLDPEMGALVADALRGIGVTLYLGERVESIDVDGGHVRAVSTRERTLPADLVVLGLGNRPSAELARTAGVPVGSTGGVVTDRRMRTDVEGVWAAGDCVETHHLVSERPVAIALGTHAAKQGRVAGINLGGGYATFPGVLGTAISRVRGVEIARTGLGEAEAADAGFAAVATVSESTTHAGYLPDAPTMRTKLVAERGTGRLLGAQIVGGGGSAKRIDVLAVAIWNRMTVDEMTGLDLAYAPPFAPVWDPVLVAARRTADAVAGDARAQAG